MEKLEITHRKKRNKDGFKKEVITISIDPETLNRIDSVCHDLRMNRSEYILHWVKKNLPTPEMLQSEDYKKLKEFSADLDDYMNAKK